METSPTWYIIVNPMSGRGKGGQIWPEIERLLQEMKFSYTVQFTERRGHATRLADDAILKGYRYLLGIGGDGTNHEICNGILSQPHAPTHDVHYALLPVGTGNDWAKTYNIPTDVRERLMRLRELKTAVQDAGFATFQRDGTTGQRYFVNVAGMAYDAYIVRELEKKPVASQFQYLLSIAKYLFDYTLTPARIFFDEKTTDDSFYIINVGICKYSGGGMQFVPQAVPNDGLLALTFARKLSKLEVLRQTPRFYAGTILGHPRVEGFSVKKVRVEHIGPTPTLLEADGEFLGETPCEFSIVENALKIVL